MAVPESEELTEPAETFPADNANDSNDGGSNSGAGSPVCQNIDFVKHCITVGTREPKNKKK